MDCLYSGVCYGAYKAIIFLSKCFQILLRNNLYKFISIDIIYLIDIFHRDFNSGYILYLHVILKLKRNNLLSNDFFTWNFLIINK